MCASRKEKEVGNQYTWVLDSNLKVTSKSQKNSISIIFFTYLREVDNDTFLQLFKFLSFQQVSPKHSFIFFFSFIKYLLSSTKSRASFRHLDRKVNKAKSLPLRNLYSSLWGNDEKTNKKYNKECMASGDNCCAEKQAE